MNLAYANHMHMLHYNFAIQNKVAQKFTKNVRRSSIIPHKLSASRHLPTIMKKWMASFFPQPPQGSYHSYVPSNQAIVFTWPISSYLKTIAISY